MQGGIAPAFEADGGVRAYEEMVGAARAGAPGIPSTSKRTPALSSPDGESPNIALNAVLKWAPNGNPADTNVKLQGEYMFRNEQGQFNTLDYDGKAQGWYLQGVYQFAPKWQFALRHDELTANNSGAGIAGTVLETFGDTARRSSAALTFLTSEFGRFRAQYNYDQAGPTTDHQVFLQYTITLGAHGAHAY